jgi:hypothetical protein
MGSVFCTPSFACWVVCVVVTASEETASDGLLTALSFVIEICSVGGEFTTGSAVVVDAAITVAKFEVAMLETTLLTETTL